MKSILRALSLVSALVGQTLMTVPLTVASGLLAPLWAVALFWIINFAAIGVLVRLIYTRKYQLAFMVPVSHLAVFIAILMFGDFVLGWTA